MAPTGFEPVFAVRHRDRLASALPDQLEQRPNCRPIRRALPDMTHRDPSHRIYENVAA